MSQYGQTATIMPLQIPKMPFAHPKPGLPKEIPTTVEISLTPHRCGTHNTASSAHNILPQLRVKIIGEDP